MASRRHDVGVSTAWPERIVVGVDDSPESSDALARALGLAARAGSTVVPVHAVGLLEGGHYKPDVDVAAAIERTNAEAQCPATLIAAPHIEPGHPAEVIVRVTADVGGDLIVVGRRGAGDTVRPLGSTSEALLAAARVPVLITVGSDPGP